MTSSSESAAATYQVFLSFRGPDTRQGFTDVLYHALVAAGVRVFRDNEEIRKGEEIGGEILRAIEESEIFLPIFSRGYASSKWCLLELTKMVESMKGSSGKKKILPVFYDVGVDDVKLKTDLYSKPLEEHSKKFGAETVKLWEEALQQSGKFKGWELKDKGFAEFAKLVVRDVSMKLKVKHKSVTEYLVRRDDQVEALMKLLDCDSPEVRFVGISGMGGIGKTTLAKVVFNKLCDRFDGCSFLADVRESSRQHKGMESLQKQLLESLGVELGNITDVGDGITRLRATLGSKKVLIVLDDIDSKDQIHNLAGNASWFGPGTRVFITTRDHSVLEIRRLEIRTLKVEELKPKEASKLFCMHAFGKDSPPDDYLSHSMEAVQSTGGLPLALAVIGSFLGDQPLQEWPDTIERLKKVPHKDVQKQLMISYEALSHETKQIFLDIACFFIGEEKTYPIYMWQACDYDPRMGLKELIYKSLVKIEENDVIVRGGKKKTLWMHDQLRDLGRAIVACKSFEDGVKPSRLWFREDASKTLHEDGDIEQVEMLRFDHRSRYTFKQKEISSLRKLRYLECKGANFSGELTNALPKLRWFSWSRCPLEFMGTGIFLRNLVILDLSWSDIDESWSGWIQIGVGTTLKVLDLSHCYKLRRTPDLSAYSSLERLILDECHSLVEIDSSISKLVGLRRLSLAWCYGLRVLPDTLDGMKSLVELDLSNTGVAELPDAIWNMKSLVKLDLSYTYVAELPDTIRQLVELQVLSLHHCRDLKKLPVSIGNMKSLVELDLAKTSVAELPDAIGQLVELQVLSLYHCEYLKKLPVSIGNMKSLVELDLSNTGVAELPDTIGQLVELQFLSLQDCQDLKKLPVSIGNMKSLVSLDLSMTSICVTKYLVPRDDQVEALMMLLDCDLPEVRFVGISGMGGIGKTTLAKIVFNKLYDRFDGWSFLANVRESSGQHKGIESLQKQLLNNLTPGSGDIRDLGDVIIKLRTIYGSKKVLIVLDDVDSKDQIRNLAGDASWFGPGSRIIITTRDQSVSEMRKLGIRTLEVEELKPKEASRLFCMQAFGKDSPPDDYLNLSMEVVQSTGGLPLALAVIGSFLGEKPRREWPDTIERLKKYLTRMSRNNL